MNKLDEQYRGILAELLYNGKEKEDRTGTGTLSKFGMQIRHKMSDGFPLLTTKKMAVKTMMTELKWFLKGDTNIKYLVDNGCNIWNGDAYKAYQNAIAEVGLFDAMMDQEEFINKIKTDDEFAKKWGDLGPIYGRMWRAFDEDSYGGIDQIANLINDLKTNPDSRRLMVTAWHPGYNQHSVLPPCHYGFQCYVADGKLSLMWSQRSVDTFLGLPFNIASYGMLLMLLCEETGYKPGDLIGNLGDVHLYNNHVEQAKEQISRDGFNLPTIKLSNVDILNGEFDYELIDYQSATSIKAPLSN
jgi:thymidylate synthase